MSLKLDFKSILIAKDAQKHYKLVLNIARSCSVGEMIVHRKILTANLKKRKMWI